MIQPIVGIRLKNSKFISLLNAEGEQEKSVILYKGDFIDSELPIYACKMQAEDKIEKIYKIGNITVAPEYFYRLKENELDDEKGKQVLKAESALSDDGYFYIRINIGTGKNFSPLKIYEANLNDEILMQEIREREDLLLDYGDFVKRESSSAFLLPEKDITEKNLLSESEINDKKGREKDSGNKTDEGMKVSVKVALFAAIVVFLSAGIFCFAVGYLLSLSGVTLVSQSSWMFRVIANVKIVASCIVALVLLLVASVMVFSEKLNQNQCDLPGTNRKAASCSSAYKKLDPTGQNRFITVCVFEIKDLKQLSEKLEPHEMIKSLNTFFGRIGKIVSKNGGYIDKLIGDSAVAVWGTPSSAGTPKRDALNAVKGVLECRKEISAINEERSSDRKPVLNVSMGINSGIAVAGNIGAGDKLEFTCIGDVIYRAYVTEAFNRECQTDILMTENTYQLVKEEVLAEKVKGLMLNGEKYLENVYSIAEMKGNDSEGETEKTSDSHL